jgi:hypothetical protein
MASYYIQIDGSHEVLLSNNATIRTLNEVTTEMSVMFKDDSQPITLDVIEKVYRVKEKSLIKELEPITKFFAIKEEAIALQGKIPGILEFDGETITYVSNECVAVIPMKVLDSDGNIVEEIPYPPLKFTWEINETVVCCESLNPKIKELPHVFEDKKICLGDYATEVIDAMDNNDLEMVINLLVLSRKGVNPGDYLGKNIYKIIDNLGYTIERDYCSDCGNDIDECSCNDVSCASCGEYVNDDDIYWDDHNNGYCQNCYSDIYFYCNECSNDKNRENGVSIYGIGSANESYEDTIICEHCVDNGEYVCCSECNHYYNYEDIEQYYDKYQESSSLCTMCKDNYHTFECEECGERHAYSKDSNVTICNQCKEDQDDTGENSVSDGTSKEELPDRDSDEGISQYVPDS